MTEAFHTYSALMDVDWMEGPSRRPSNEVIAEQLCSALDTCQYVVFFETHARLTAFVNSDESVRNHVWRFDVTFQERKATATSSTQMFQKPVTVAGKGGGDAKGDQEKAVQRAIGESTKLI